MPAINPRRLPFINRRQRRLGRVFGSRAGRLLNEDTIRAVRSFEKKEGIVRRSGKEVRKAQRAAFLSRFVSA